MGTPTADTEREREQDDGSDRGGEGCTLDEARFMLKTASQSRRPKSIDLRRPCGRDEAMRWGSVGESYAACRHT